MPNTFDPIQTYTFPTNGNEVIFSTISQSYTHLYVLLELKNVSGFPGLDYYMQINGDGSNSYSSVIMAATSNARSSGRRDALDMAQLFYLMAGSAIGGTTTGQIWLPFYKDASSKRNFQVKGGEAVTELSQMSGFYNSTAPITSLRFTSGSTPDIGAGSSITIYGILEA